MISIAKPLNLPIVKCPPIIKSKPSVPLFSAPKAIPKIAAEAPAKTDKDKPEIPEASKKLLGPTYDPNLIEQYSKEPQSDQGEPEVKKQKLETLENPSEAPAMEATTSQSAKKRKNRLRNREKQRSNVDIEDFIEEEEVKEKVVKWVPPNNQKGDGFTALNDKFGY